MIICVSNIGMSFKIWYNDHIIFTNINYFDIDRMSDPNQ